MINKNNYERVSKFLSKILRHHPEDLELKMDKNGWINVNELLKAINSKQKYSKTKFTFEDIKYIVETNDKQRFALEERKHQWFIRANQGHSIKDIDLELEPIKPPDVLYHGTGKKYIDSIFKTGINKKQRQYVHLSTTEETALNVGKRHGEVVILEIDAKQMYEDNFIFYCSKNNVWLTDSVPNKYIKTKKWFE